MYASPLPRFPFPFSHFPGCMCVCWESIFRFSGILRRRLPMLFVILSQCHGYGIWCKGHGWLVRWNYGPKAAGANGIVELWIPSQLFLFPLPISICESANNKVKMKWLGTNGKASVYMKSWVGLWLWVWWGIYKEQGKGKGKRKELVTNTLAQTEAHSRSLCTFWQPMKHALIAPATLS